MKLDIKKLGNKLTRRIRKKHIISVVLLLGLACAAMFGYVYYVINNADYIVRIAPKAMINETYLDEEASNVMGNGSSQSCSYYIVSGKLKLKVSETIAIEKSTEDVRDSTRFDDAQGKDYFYAALRLRFKQDPNKIFLRYETAESSFGSGYKIEYRTYINNGARLTDIEETILDKVFMQLHNGDASDNISETTDNILLKDLILIRDSNRYIVIANNTIYKTDYQQNLIKLMTIPEGSQLDYIWFTKNVFTL